MISGIFWLIPLLLDDVGVPVGRPAAPQGFLKLHVFTMFLSVSGGRAAHRLPRDVNAGVFMYFLCFFRWFLANVDVI